MNLYSCIKPVVSTVNFIHSHGLCHPQFCEFLSDTGTEYPDLPYHTAVLGLSSDTFLFFGAQKQGFSNRQLTAPTTIISLKINFCCRLDSIS